MLRSVGVSGINPTVKQAYNLEIFTHTHTHKHTRVSTIHNFKKLIVLNIKTEMEIVLQMHIEWKD